MGRIEEIKNQVSRWKDIEHVSPELWADQVLYLLSKLEIAGKALEDSIEAMSNLDRIVFNDRAVTLDDYEEDESITKAREALEQLRS